MYFPFDVICSESQPRHPLIGHIPHSSTVVPMPWRSQIVLHERELKREILVMTDHFTDEFFSTAIVKHGGSVFINRLSRLVFDPERFELDDEEPMARKGMGAVYTRMSDGGILRSPTFSVSDRDAIMSELYRPYALGFKEEVSAILDRFGRCLIIDGHSFPKHPLPYEDPSLERPDICIGFDSYHAAESTVTAVETATLKAGMTVRRNQPFAGSYVPISRYKEDPRVTSIMIEVNRGLYMDEVTGEKRPDFDRTARLVDSLVGTAVLFEAFRNTNFRAQTPAGNIAIRIGSACPPLDDLLRSIDARSWAYLTAYNPYGRTASESENRTQQELLVRQLREAGCLIFEGAGEADIGNWPPEPSVLAIGINRERAMQIAERFSQAAFVAGALGSVPELLQVDH